MSAGGANGSERPTISVLLPCYNHAAYVEKALRSIYAQTRLPDELLVIDDGSRDDSVRVLERVLADSPIPARLIARENRGLCATLNEGLQTLRGDLFAYLGSDDAWAPERLALGSEALAAHPEAVVAYSHCYVMDQDGKIIGCTADWETYGSGKVLPQLLAARSVPVSPTVLFRRAPLAEVGWNERSKLEDYEVLLQLAARGDFVFIPKPLAYWRKHGENTSRNVPMMLSEVLRAQAAVGERSGLSRRELWKYRSAIRFRYANYFLRAGDRLKAIELSLTGLPGAESVEAVVRRLARLCTPLPVLNWNDERLSRRARRKYDTTE